MGLFRIYYEALKARFDAGDVVSPLDFSHIGKLRWLLSSLGGWPHKQLGSARIDAILSIYNLFLIFLALVLATLSTAYLHQHWEHLKFFDMGHIILTVLLDILSMIYSEIHKISEVFTTYMAFLICCGPTLFNVKPLYNNFRNGMFSDRRPANSTFEHSVYFYFPTDDVYTTEKGYWILFAFNIPNSYNVTCGVVMFDVLLIVIVLQIWGHLKILKHNMLSIPQPETIDDQMGGMYSAEENIQVKQLLKDIVVHHNFITKFVDKCSDAFSEYLFVFYLIHQVISCILLLEISSLTTQALMMYAPLTWGMFQQLILLSVLFEITNTKSEQLIDAAYAIPWENMDKGNRKTVLLLLQKVQTPVSLRAGGVVPVGVGTMSAVVLLWNSLPVELRSVNSIGLLTNKIKEHFLSVQ